jgi:hypothetical protein
MAEGIAEAALGRCERSRPVSGRRWISSRRQQIEGFWYDPVETHAGGEAMTVEPFLRPRLIGTRFEGHSIPLEVLKDLAVLEELIVEVAKSEFLKDHPRRQRSPRRFTDGIALKLTAVEDGSAVPVITLSIAATSHFPPENQLYFERARDAMIKAISAAERNQAVTQYLPEKTLGYFDRLGRSLREGEAIEFSSPGLEMPARLTKESRRKLVLASSRVKEMTEEVTVRGSIPEADKDNMTFELQLIDGRKVTAPISAQHSELILEAFNAYEKGSRVLIQGIGRLNRNDKLVGFEAIEHITVLDPLDLPSRLDDLRLLKNGWCEGAGSAPPSSGLDWLTETFTRGFSEDLPLPFVYPTPEGGIRLEWSLDPYDLSLDIDLVTHVAKLHQLNLTSDEEKEEALNLGEDTGWNRLREHIQLLAGVTA